MIRKPPATGFSAHIEQQPHFRCNDRQHHPPRRQAGCANQVELFAALPTTLLVALAARLQERFEPAETVIFEKGAPGDSLYLVVTGEVEALDGERIFTRMGAREIFGEMALLDGELRTATIRTAQPTHLLCLEQAAFYELMDEHIEIARGVIHVLLQRLRARTADVNRLQAQLDRQHASVAVTPPPPPVLSARPVAPR